MNDPAKPTGANATDGMERRMWKVTIAAPIDLVWSTLVQTEKVLPFLFGAICETRTGLQPGAKMRMVSADRKRAMVVGEVLAFSPPHLFSHTTAFTQVTGEAPGRTTYELKEIAGGTELTLISEAVAGSKTARMAKSGPFIVNNIKALLETGKPTFAGRLVMLLNAIFGGLMPRVTHVENWPLESTAAGK